MHFRFPRFLVAVLVAVTTAGCSDTATLVIQVEAPDEWTVSGVEPDPIKSSIRLVPDKNGTTPNLHVSRRLSYWIENCETWNIDLELRCRTRPPDFVMLVHTRSDSGELNWVSVYKIATDHIQFELFPGELVNVYAWWKERGAQQSKLLEDRGEPGESGGPGR